MSNRFDAHAINYSQEIDKTLQGYGMQHDTFTAHKAWLINRIMCAEGRDERQMDLLDVGCGVGKIHAHLKDRFRSITGADVSAASLVVARETFPDIGYHHYDGEHLPFPDNSFDFTTAIGVFHHVPPALWQNAAKEMLRILRAGGLALVIEHNPYNPVTRRIVRTCPLDEGVVLLQPSQLRRLFAGAGGERITTRSILTMPPLRPWIMSLDMSFGRLPLGAQYFMLAQRAPRAGLDAV